MSSNASRERNPTADAIPDFLLSVAYHQARRFGLSYEDSEDCAMEFVTRMLRPLTEVTEVTEATETGERAGEGEGTLPLLRRHYGSRLESASWVYCCARNFARDYSRSQAGRSRYEHPWPTVNSDEAEIGAWDAIADPELAPEAEILRREFWARFFKLVEHLPPIPRAFFVRHHLQGECIQSLASLSGRTPHAVEQALLRARQRLRKGLTRQGLVETDRHGRIHLLYPLWKTRQKYLLKNL